jgi:hypothetical protein
MKGSHKEVVTITAELKRLADSRPGCGKRTRLKAASLQLALLLTVSLPGLASEGGNPAPDSAYRDRTDEELTALAASWDSLDRLERRALLTEMKVRMARNGTRKGDGTLHIRTERRYGRIVRQSDGRVIHIETQVVHVRPFTGDETGGKVQGRQQFGVGFEQRVARRQATEGMPVPGRADDALSDLIRVMEPPPQAPLTEAPLPTYQVSEPAP